MSSTQSRPSPLSQSLATAREVRGFEQAVAWLQSWMQEKATLMARDVCGHSPSSVQTLEQQHRCLEVRAHTPWSACRSPSLQVVGSTTTTPRPAPPQPGRAGPGRGAVELAWEILGNRSEPLREDWMLPNEGYVSG